MTTAAQHNKSANKNKYRILNPFEEIIKQIKDKMIIKNLDNLK